MKENKIWLDHMRESFGVVEDGIRGISFGDFAKNVHLQDSVVLRIEIIGEAASNIPEDFRAKHPQIKWSKIIGMRNILAHEYFGVDLKIVWLTATERLPELKKVMNVELC